jgi:diacylglycerol kinase/glycosyltransferase involved in cell wall biosynthesis
MMPENVQKILIVTDAWYPQVNGVVRSLTHTRDTLIEMGNDVTMLTPEFFRTVPCPTYPEIRLSLMPGSRVASFIHELVPDIIHIATEGPLGLAARNFCLRHGLQFTTAYHTRFPEYIHSRFRIPLSLTYGFLRWFHRPSAKVMVPTKTVQEDLTHWRVGTPVLWPRGVDLELFRPVIKRKIKGKPIFLYVGRISVEKNIESFLSLDLEGEKWVVGDGPLLEEIKSRFPDAVYFGMKAKEDLPDFYQKADVFVFPSRTDTFGLVLLEAMACGLPVAAYPVTGPVDVVGSSGAGILDDDLEKACLEALNIPRQKVRRYAETFSWQAATTIFAEHLLKTRPTDAYHIIDNPYKNNIGVKRALNAARHSLSGIRFAITEESAFRQELLLGLPLLVLAFLLPVGLLEQMLMVCSVLLVFIVELLNSSIEAAVDRISLSRHDLSRRAKDYGSAAVMMALIFCGVVYTTCIVTVLMR